MVCEGIGTDVHLNYFWKAPEKLALECILEDNITHYLLWRILTIFACLSNIQIAWLPLQGEGWVAGRLGLETKLELEEPLKGFPEAFTTDNDTRNKTK